MNSHNSPRSLGWLPGGPKDHYLWAIFIVAGSYVKHLVLCTEEQKPRQISCLHSTYVQEWGDK